MDSEDNFNSMMMTTGTLIGRILHLGDCLNISFYEKDSPHAVEINDDLKGSNIEKQFSNVKSDS